MLSHVMLGPLRFTTNRVKDCIAIQSKYLLLQGPPTQSGWRNSSPSPEGFSDWINTNLGEDLHLTHILPLADSGLSLYDAVKDGILLCKIVNHSCPDTVDERVINMKPNSVYKM